MDRRSFVAGTLGLLLLVDVAAQEAWGADDPALALLSDRRWPGTVITYGFPPAGFRWEYSSTWTANFVPANDAEKALFRKVLAGWAAASGGAVSFVEARPGMAQIRLAVTRASLGRLPNGTPIRGWTYYPGTGARAGDIWLQAGLRALGYADRRKGGWIMRHETGHALGLKHPHQGTPTLPAELDCAAHTVMTYRTYCGDPTPDGWPDTLRSYPQVLGDLDGRAVRLLYAAPPRAAASGLQRPAQPGRDGSPGQE